MLPVLGTIVDGSLVSMLGVQNGVSYRYGMGAYGRAWILDIKTIKRVLIAYRVMCVVLMVAMMATTMMTVQMTLLTIEICQINGANFDSFTIC